MIFFLASLALKNSCCVVNGNLQKKKVVKEVVNIFEALAFFANILIYLANKLPLFNIYTRAFLSKKLLLV